MKLAGAFAFVFGELLSFAFNLLQCIFEYLDCLFHITSLVVCGFTAIISFNNLFTDWNYINLKNMKLLYISHIMFKNMIWLENVSLLASSEFSVMNPIQLKQSIWYTTQHYLNLWSTFNFTLNNHFPLGNV